MEDTHLVMEHPALSSVAFSATDKGKQEVKRSIFAVYDGHGGIACAEFLRTRFVNTLLANKNFELNPIEAIRDSLASLEKVLCSLCVNYMQAFLECSSGNKEWSLSGSTAIVCYLSDHHLTVANIGDSRAVLCREGKAVALSIDHKPDRSDERIRIEANGGFVARHPEEAAYLSLSEQQRNILLYCCCTGSPSSYDGPNRIFPGGIAVSRSIGDLEVKLQSRGPCLIADPEFTQTYLCSGDEFMIIACDGLWDVLSNQEAVDIALSCSDPKEASKKLCFIAFDRGSCDNISALVVFFQQPFSAPGIHDLSTPPAGTLPFIFGRKETIKMEAPAVVV